MSQRIPLLKVNVPILMHARTVYTEAILDMFQDEYEKSLLVVIDRCIKIGATISVAEVSELGAFLCAVFAASAVSCWLCAVFCWFGDNLMPKVAGFLVHFATDLLFFCYPLLCGAQMVMILASGAAGLV
ncbi:hypothetical protein U1Q18_050277 [Sarracenia purpurea var. burkii]